MRVSDASSGWIEEFSRGIRFSRNITEREYSVTHLVMLVQGESIGGLRSSHEICLLV